jgi:hypothetical protein
MSTFKSFAALAAATGSPERDLALDRLRQRAAQQLLDHRGRMVVEDPAESYEAQLARTEAALLRDLQERGPSQLQLWLMTGEFARWGVCDRCFRERKLTCAHPHEQEAFARTLTTLPKTSWAFISGMLTLHEWWEHRMVFGRTTFRKPRKVEEHPNGDRRVWAGATRDTVLHEGVEIAVVDGGKTAFLDALDQRGWDRPTSYAQRTAEPAEQSTTKPRTPIYIHQLGQGRTLLFYRHRGRWYAARTHQQCHVMLHNAIQRRWRALFPGLPPREVEPRKPRCRPRRSRRRRRCAPRRWRCRSTRSSRGSASGSCSADWTRR